ncbi:MAG: trigger factor [Desulfobacteraceae bacterium 4572_19]|nr:MAG: trigger factor [Desulfobacteraceae bacterium 4572_19]
MQVTVEDVNTVKKILHIEVPKKDVAKAFDKAYQELRKTSKLRGFRPGKAPRKVLEGMFHKDVHQDVLSKLVQTSFADALKELKLINAIGEPKINPPMVDPDDAYKYDATIELKPDIEDIDFKGIEITKNIYTLSDDMVDGQLEMLRKQFAKKELIEEARPIQNEDFILIDIEGFIDGKPYDKTPFSKNFTMQIGRGVISKNFDEEMIGMEVGDEKEILVDYPAFNSDGTPSNDPNFNVNMDLAGNKIVYKVKLNEIRYEILPDLDDEFAKKLGQYESLDTLKQAILDNLKQGFDRRTEQELAEQIYVKLFKDADFELPEMMVKYEFESILAEAEQSLKSSDKTLEQAGYTKETLTRMYWPLAENQVRRHLILDKIANQEELLISDEELEDGFKNMAKSINQSVEMVKQFYSGGEEKILGFKQTLREQKAFNLVLESSKITEVQANDKTASDKDDAKTQSEEKAVANEDLT